MDDSELISTGLTLPARMHEPVAEALLANSKAPSHTHLDQLWAQESESRIDALLAGRIKTIGGEKGLQYRSPK